MAEAAKETPGKILREAANADVFTPRERAGMGLGERVKKAVGAKIKEVGKSIVNKMLETSTAPIVPAYERLMGEGSRPEGKKIPQPLVHEKAWKDKTEMTSERAKELLHDIQWGVRIDRRMVSSWGLNLEKEPTLSRFVWIDTEPGAEIKATNRKEIIVNRCLLALQESNNPEDQEYAALFNLAMKVHRDIYGIHERVQSTLIREQGTEKISDVKDGPTEFPSEREQQEYLTFMLGVWEEFGEEVEEGISKRIARYAVDKNTGEVLMEQRYPWESHKLRVLKQNIEKFKRDSPKDWRKKLLSSSEGIWAVNHDRKLNLLDPDDIPEYSELNERDRDTAQRYLKWLHSKDLKAEVWMDITRKLREIGGVPYNREKGIFPVSFRSELDRLYDPYDIRQSYAAPLLKRVGGMPYFQTLYELMLSQPGWSIKQALYEEWLYMVMDRIWITNIAHMKHDDRHWTSFDDIESVPRRGIALSLEFINNFARGEFATFWTKHHDQTGDLLLKARNADYWQYEHLREMGFTERRARELSQNPGREAILSMWRQWASEKLEAESLVHQRGAEGANKVNLKTVEDGLFEGFWRNIFKTAGNLKNWYEIASRTDAFETEELASMYLLYLNQAREAKINPAGDAEATNRILANNDTLIWNREMKVSVSRETIRVKRYVPHHSLGGPREPLDLVDKTLPYYFFHDDDPKRWANADVCEVNKIDSSLPSATELAGLNRNQIYEVLWAIATERKLLARVVDHESNTTYWCDWRGAEEIVWQNIANKGRLLPPGATPQEKALFEKQQADLLHGLSKAQKLFINQRGLDNLTRRFITDARIDNEAEAIAVLGAENFVDENFVVEKVRNQLRGIKGSAWNLRDPKERAARQYYLSEHGKTRIDSLNNKEQCRMKKEWNAVFLKIDTNLKTGKDAGVGLTDNEKIIWQGGENSYFVTQLPVPLERYKRLIETIMPSWFWTRYYFGLDAPYQDMQHPYFLYNCVNFAIRKKMGVYGLRNEKKEMTQPLRGIGFNNAIKKSGGPKAMATPGEYQRMGFLERQLEEQKKLIFGYGNGLSGEDLDGVSQTGQLEGRGESKGVTGDFNWLWMLGDATFEPDEFLGHARWEWPDTLAFNDSLHNVPSFLQFWEKPTVEAVYSKQGYDPLIYSQLVMTPWDLGATPDMKVYLGPLIVNYGDNGFFYSLQSPISAEHALPALSQRNAEVLINIAGTFPGGPRDPVVHKRNQIALGIPDKKRKDMFGTKEIEQFMSLGKNAVPVLGQFLSVIEPQAVLNAPAIATMGVGTVVSLGLLFTPLAPLGMLGFPLSLGGGYLVGKVGLRTIQEEAMRNFTANDFAGDPAKFAEQYIKMNGSRNPLFFPIKD